jgi:hypothetical protein
MRECFSEDCEFLGNRRGNDNLLPHLNVSIYKVTLLVEFLERCYLSFLVLPNEEKNTIIFQHSFQYFSITQCLFVF